MDRFDIYYEKICQIKKVNVNWIRLNFVSTKQQVVVKFKGHKFFPDHVLMLLWYMTYQASSIIIIPKAKWSMYINLIHYI